MLRVSMHRYAASWYIGSGFLTTKDVTMNRVSIPASRRAFLQHPSVVRQPGILAFGSFLDRIIDSAPAHNSAETLIDWYILFFLLEQRNRIVEAWFRIILAIALNLSETLPLIYDYRLHSCMQMTGVGSKDHFSMTACTITGMSDERCIGCELI